MLTRYLAGTAGIIMLGGLLVWNTPMTTDTEVDTFVLPAGEQGTGEPENPPEDRGVQRPDRDGLVAAQSSITGPPAGPTR